VFKNNNLSIFCREVYFFVLSEFLFISMTRVFLLSDTHSYWNSEWIKYFEAADQIWHAGDIGDEKLLQKINEYSQNKELKIVYGNIDGNAVRIQTAEHCVFELEGFKVLIIHIAGTFRKYNQHTKDLISRYQPNILVCGHSHILKVRYDPQFHLWYMNPGAAGKYGFHPISTALFFELNEGKIQNFNIIEWEKNKLD
jgi:putative phosphoesterase